MTPGAAQPPEQTILETRQHWLAAGLWWRLLLFLILVVISFVLLNPRAVSPVGFPLGVPVLVLDLLALVFLLIVPYVRWHSRVYRLTNHRLIIEEGLVTRRSKSIPLARLQDITSEIGPLGRIMGYGSLRVENAGESPGHDLLRDVPHPAQFRDLLLEYAANARNQGM